MACLTLSGSAYERGLGQARLCPESAPQVRRMIRSRLSEAAALLQGERVSAYLAAQWAFCEAHTPRAMAETQGIAEGFGLEPRDVFTFLHLGFLAPLAHAQDGCSTVALARSADGPMIAKNRDYRGDHQALQRLFLHRDPASPETACLMLGSLGAPGAFSSGMNSHGLALADTRVDWPRPGIGWLRYFLMTEILWRASSVAEALAFIRAVPHVGGGSLALGDAEGRVAMAEFGSGGAVVSEGPEALVHTNHFIALELAAAAGALLPDATSQSSLGRLAALHAASAAFDGAHTRHRDLMALLSSHGGGAGQLCRHRTEAEDGTISGVVFLCRAREVWFADGTPCSAPWQRAAF